MDVKEFIEPFKKAFTEKKMKKKGQLEIGINVMIIFAFLILLIISLIVYFRFTYSDIKETQQVVLDEKFSTLVNAINEMPEFKCSFKNSGKECLDVKKLQAFSRLGNKEDYLDEFGIKGLIVEEVYPEDVGVIFTLGVNKGLRYSTPVSLYEDNEYKIGKLIIVGDVN